MTPAEVTAALVDRVPGRRLHALPLIKRGARVSVRYRDLAANGTILSSYGSDGGNAISRVRLDETDTVIEVTWDLIYDEVLA